MWIGIRYRYRDSDKLHGYQIAIIITHENAISGIDALLCDDLLQNCAFIPNALDTIQVKFLTTR